MTAYGANKKSSSDEIHELKEHMHKEAKCYPTGAAGVTVTAGDAAAWTLGNYAEVVPVSTIGSAFDIHYIAIEAVSTATTYEVVLYASTTEIGRIRITALGTPNNVTFPDVPFMMPIVAANTQIQAKVMSASGDADTITISLFYHTY